MLQSKELFRKIEELRKALKDLQPLKTEVKILVEEKFRLEFNYNSNHIEGNTLTYGETELLLKFGQVDGNHDFQELQEMQAHNVAFQMIENEAMDLERPLTESFIRSLNGTLLVKPYWKDAITQEGKATRKQILPGVYKTTPNSVILNNGTIFNYTSPNEVSNEMAALVDWFNKNEELEDPLIIAATLHYKFVRIHPFDDGNGRTARLLMNYVLLKFGFPVVVIKSEEKRDYLSALNKADVGDLQYFIDYIGNQLIWSLDITIKAAQGESIDEIGDIEKELALLRRKISVLPNEFDQKKSVAMVKETMRLSIFPLFQEMETFVINLADLFVETKSLLFTSFIDNGIPNAYVLKELGQIDSIIKRLPNEGSLYFSLTALKKATSSAVFEYRFPINYEEYHYLILSTDNEPLIRLPYGRHITAKNIKEIVTIFGREIIADIKEATNMS
jgi:Fic family protein